MAKPIKKTDRNKKHIRSVRDLSRKKPTRIPRRRILIVCEGEKTEPRYFTGLRNKYRLNTVEVEIIGEECGSAPSSVVRYACNRKKSGYYSENDEVWCVIDVEGYDNPRDLTGPLLTASDNDINVALSNPCFEVWLLYHFERVGRAFDNCQGVIHELRKHITDYDKGIDYFNDSFSANISSAIRNAESIMSTHWQDERDRLRKNPSTEVFQLVKMIQDNVG